MKKKYQLKQRLLSDIYNKEETHTKQYGFYLYCFILYTAKCRILKLKYAEKVHE